MKRLFVLTAFLTVLAGCRSVDSNATDPSAEVFGQESFKPIEFVIKDTSATKSPAPITSLSQFNVTATTGSAGSEASKFSNVVFANRSGVFKSDAVWPAADPKYHFYASNVAMTHTASGQTVTISNIDKDVVCAYLVSPSYKVKNDLVFNHILARVGTVTFTNLSLCSNVNLSMKYSGSGTYNISTGAWSGLGSQSTKELTTADNDLWIIPGSYDATLIYTDANGNPQSKTISQDFLAGKVNNISAKLDGSVVVKTEEEYEAPTFTLGTISDVPAGGGDSGTPSVTSIGQSKRVKKTLADGTVEYDPDWTAVSNPNYTIQYGKTLSSLSDNCPSYHGDNLGTTARERTIKGSICVRVTANGKWADQTIDVYQAENYIKNNTVSLSNSSINVGASCTVTYNGVWASGSSVTGYWSSDNSSVATVSGSSRTGTVTGKKSGDTWINFNPDGGEQCYKKISVSGPVITKTEIDTDVDSQNKEWDDGYWVKINGKTSDIRNVDVFAGSVTVTATAGYVHHVQPQKHTRSRNKYTWSDGSVTYDDWSLWSEWSNAGSESKKDRTADPTMKSSNAWLTTSGSYEANASTNTRTATITASYGGATATLNVNQAANYKTSTNQKSETESATSQVTDTDYWVKINGETNSSVDVTAAAGSVTVNVTAGHTHTEQPRKKTRTYDEYIWAVGPNTTGNYSGWTEVDDGNPTVTYPSDTPTLSSDNSWLDKNGSYTENTGTSSRTGKITAAVKVGTTTKASATLTVNQAAATITYKLTCTGSAVSMKVGESKSFSPTVKRQKYVNGKASGIASEFSTGVTFVIGDSSIATITSQTYSSKKVKGESVGSTKIYAKMTIDGVEYNSKDNGDSGISVTVTSNDQYEVEVE